MATSTLPPQAPAVTEVDFTPIDQLAQLVQDHATRAKYLIAAIDGAADDAVDCGDTSAEGRPRRAEAIDRIIVLARLAKTEAEKAGQFGAMIEEATLSRGGD